jgi:hypothetical protein
MHLLGFILSVQLFSGLYLPDMIKFKVFSCLYQFSFNLFLALERVYTLVNTVLIAFLLRGQADVPSPQVYASSAADPSRIMSMRDQTVLATLFY